MEKDGLESPNDRGPEHRPERRARAAEERHQRRQQASLHAERDPGVDETRVQREEHAGSGRRQARDHEGGGLVLHEVEADAAGSRFILLDAAEGQSEPAPRQVRVEPHRDGGEKQSQIVPDKGAHEEARRYVETVGAPGERSEVQREHLEQEDQDERADREVQALEPEERERHHRGEQRGDDERARRDQQGRERAELLHARDVEQDGGDVGAEAEERALAQVHVAEKAVQHVVVRGDDEPHEAEEHDEQPARREERRQRAEERDDTGRDRRRTPVEAAQ